MSWFKIENKADRAEVWIYDVIGTDWWTGEGITSKSFQKELAAIKANQIDLHINSIGGDVQEGAGIYNLIKQHPAHVTTYIDGWAASIASVVALAGDEINMAENGLFMMHNPSSGIWGTAADLRSRADVLDKVRDSMLNVYMGKSGKSEYEIKELLDAETWMTADDALEAGFVDQIGAEMDMAACAKFIPIVAKMGLRNVPSHIAQEKPTARTLERALRDAGCSAKKAKMILSMGLPESFRDEDDSQVKPTVTATTPRDDEPEMQGKKDRVASLLTRAEVIAPSA